MLEELKKSIDKGLDYAFATKDKLTKAAQELAKENKLTKEEAKKLYDHLLKKSDEARKTLEADMQVFVHNTMKKMNIPTAEEIKKLEERIKKLEAGGKTPVKPRAKPKAKPVKKGKPAAAKKAVK
jgi:polyhydroxyalkanoate synthesis regulator phasin